MTVDSWSAAAAGAVHDSDVSRKKRREFGVHGRGGWEAAVFPAMYGEVRGGRVLRGAW
jgi:hypothetical protein